MCVCVPKYVITIVVFVGLVLIWDSGPVNYTFNLIPSSMCIFVNLISICSCIKGCKVNI